MEIRKLTDELSVAQQITPADVAALAAAGFKSIVCNRPDGEEEGQIPFEDIARVANEHGMQAAHLPVISGQVQDDQAVQMAGALAELPAPVFAFCRTGTRSTVLWALSRAGRQPTDEVLSIAKNAGYDLEAMRNRLDCLVDDPLSAACNLETLIVCPGVSTVSKA